MRVSDKRLHWCSAIAGLLLLSCDPEGGAKAGPKTWRVTTLAGGGSGFQDGAGKAARFNNPSSIAVSEDEKSLYIADTGNHRIRRIALAGGEVTTLAGSGTRGDANGRGDSAEFRDPNSIVAYRGKLYVSDNSTHQIRVIDIATKQVGALGIAAGSLAPAWGSLVIKPDGSALYVLEARNGGRIRVIDMKTKAVTILAGPDTVRGITPMNGVGDEVVFNQPKGMAISPDGTVLVVADNANALHDIRSVHIAARAVGTIATLGEPPAGVFGAAAGLAIATYNTVFVADGKANRIKRIFVDGVFAEIQNFAGDGTAGTRDGPLNKARFNRPEAIAVNREGDKIYVADAGSHTIRMIAYR